MMSTPRYRYKNLLLASGCVLAVAAGLTGCTRATKPQPTDAPAAAPAGKPVPQAPAAAPAAPEAAPVPNRGDEPPAAGGSAAAPAALVSRLAAATDSDARVAIIDEIGAIGQNARPALDALLKALGDAEPRVRWHAARAIGLIGEDALSAVPALVGLLGDADPIVVTQAAAAIGLVREDDGRATIPDADAAVYGKARERLLATVAHSDPRARRAALRALRRLTDSPRDLAPLVAERLADADPAVILSAMHTLADMKELAVPFLLEAIKDPRSRYWAEVAVAEIGPEAAAAVEPLATIVAAGEPEDRLQAILALGAIGEAAAPAVPALVKLVEADDATFRLPAAFALGQIRASAADECLARLAAAEDPFPAAVAAWARARISPANDAVVADAVARLRQQLASADPEARSGAASGLSDLAPGLSAETRGLLAEELLGLLSDAEPRVGTAAGAALIRLGGAAIEPLRGRIADPKLRLPVMEILAAIGPAAKPALPELLQAVGDADPRVRGEAAVAIAAIGPDAVAAVQTLQSLLEDESVPAAARYPAAYALGRIGPAASAAEPAVRRLSSSSDEMMATVATWAALKMKPEDSSLFESAIPLLRRALRGDQELVRLEAAIALGDIGPAAASAIPLLELVSEEDPARQVRAAAAAALAKIRGT